MTDLHHGSKTCARRVVPTHVRTDSGSGFHGRIARYVDIAVPSRRIRLSSLTKFSVTLARSAVDWVSWDVFGGDGGGVAAGVGVGSRQLTTWQPVEQLLHGVFP